MKKNILKKLLPSLLAIIMLVSVVPLSSFGIRAGALNYEFGDIVDFGSYPQSRVIDEALIDELNSQSLNWIFYEYYSGDGGYKSMVQSDYMKYADVTYDGNKYRAVEFSLYRPSCTSGMQTAMSTNQDDNGYYPNTVYWFKYEPLKWKVLDPATGLVLSAISIDAQAYSNTIYGTIDFMYNNEEQTHYANNYATSSIREWLNDDFYNTAFSASQQDEILFTELDNSSPYYANRFGSESTTDKVFLLSSKDLRNTSYGFENMSGTADVVRTAESSEYAKIQGCQRSENGIEKTSWALRTAGDASGSACAVFADGKVYPKYNVSYVSIGVRPALRINLTPDIPTTKHHDVNITVTPDCKSTVSGGGSYSDGDTAQVSVTLASREIFVGWFVNDILVSTDKTYCFTVTESVNFEARIEKDTRPRGAITYVKFRDKKVDTNYNRTVDLHWYMEYIGEKPEYTISFSSSNPDVAIIDSKGNIKTVGTGSATITIKVISESGLFVSDTCELNVTFTTLQWFLYYVCFGWIWM